MTKHARLRLGRVLHGLTLAVLLVSGAGAAGRVVGAVRDITWQATAPDGTHRHGRAGATKSTKLGLDHAIS